MTFCTLTVTEHTTVEDVIRESLRQFNLDPQKVSDYNLVEVSLDVGGTLKERLRLQRNVSILVVERTVDTTENILRLYNSLKRVSD